MGRSLKGEEEYDPNYNSSRRKRNQKARKDRIKKFNSSTWTQQEQKLYIEFLKQFIQSFKTQEQRKKSKIFVKMSSFLKSRHADQCRSHHQKMYIKCGSIERIIEVLPQEILLNHKTFEQNSLETHQIENQMKQQEKDKIQIKFQNYNKELMQEQIVTPSDFQSEQEKIWDLIDNGTWISNTIYPAF